MKKSTAISRMIESLTNDEDLRQDLWVEYLINKSVSTFISIIDNNEYDDQDKVLNYCWQLCYYDPNDIIKELLWH